MKLNHILLMLVALLASPLGAWSEVYPSRAVHLIVPFAAGGPADGIGRLIGPRLSEAMGQPVVIDNRAGANSIVGSELASRALPDGYTLVLVSAGFTVNASLYSKLPFDPIKDFSPVSLVTLGPGILVIHASLPVKNLLQLIALAKAKPGSLSYGSSGSGAPTSHLGMELLKVIAGIDVVHVPYRSMSPAIVDLLGGQIQMAIPTINVTLPHIISGRLRALGVTSRERSSAVPQVPPLSEQGMPDYEANNWYGLLAPAGLPKPIAETIYADAAKALQLQDLKDRLSAVGMVAKAMTPENFGLYIKSEIVKWAKVVRASGAKPD